MAPGATAGSFATACGINALVGFICFISFSFLRKSNFSKRFYTAKRYLPDTILHEERKRRPKAIGHGLFAWLGPVFTYTEEEVLHVAGWDAVVYLRLLRFGMALFTFLTLWMWIVVLPTNAAGGKYVDKLTSSPPKVVPFAYWISPPPPPLLAGQPEPPPAPEVKTPKFYENIPPAPEGLLWWNYKPSVPPLPSVRSVLGPRFSSYQWRRDPNYATKSSYEFTNLDKASMSNIPPKSSLLGVHVVSAWVMTLFVLWMLWRYAKKSVVLRIRYLVTQPKGADSNTVLVQDIPGVPFGTQAARAKTLAPAAIANKIELGIQKSTDAALKAAKSGTSKMGPRGEASSPLFRHDEKGSAGADPADTFDAWSKGKAKLQQTSMAAMVEEEYDELFPGEVLAVQPVFNTTKLEPLDKEYDKLSQKLWDLIGDYNNKVRKGKAPAPKKRKKVRVMGAMMGAWGREKYGMKPIKKDALEYWPERLERLKEEIMKETTEAHDKTVPCAFVTFRSRRSQVVASTSMINHDLSSWQTSPAPAPATVYWRNIRWRAWERSARSSLIWVAFWALCFFYLIPIGFVQGFVNVDLLGKYPPFKQLLDIKFTNAIIVSILPGLVLKIFLALLPLLLAFMNKLAGMQSLAEIDFGVMVKYFIFQVLTVWLGTMITGSFLSQLNQWIDSPSSAVNILGTAVPKTASFWLTFYSLSALWTVPFSGLGIVGLVFFWIKTKVAATEKARARCWQNQDAKYGADVVDVTFAIMIGLVYCIIQPVITIVILLFFMTSFVVVKYNLIYRLRPAYESGGLIWPRVHNQILFSLILAQLVLVFILAIKKVNMQIA